MQLDQRRYSMRVCLKDIIGTDEEKVFMQYLEDSRTNFNVPVLLKFWYNDGTISDKKLDNFVRNYKHILAYYGTKIYSVESLKNGVGDDAWFNVTNETGWKDNMDMIPEGSVIYAKWNDEIKQIKIQEGADSDASNLIKFIIAGLVMHSGIVMFFP